MPELPEVETVRRGLVSAMEGARFAKVEVRCGALRRPLPGDFARRLEGLAATGLGRRGKYLLVDLSSGDVLIMHLGMSGSFYVDRPKIRHPEVRAKRASKGDGPMASAVHPSRAAEFTIGPATSGRTRRRPPQDDDETLGNYYHERQRRAAHDHVVFHMSSGAVVIFNDPRRFGAMKIVAGNDLEAEPLIAALGPEPLGDAFDAAMLARVCRGRKTSLKAALLDQRVVAGLGNIYVCEALYRARLSPKRMAATVAGKTGAPNARAKRLVAGIKAVLKEAIAAGGSSLRNHKRTDGELGMFQHRFRVYDREGEWCPTPGCRGTVKRIVQNGRSTFYCPACQK